MINHKKLSYVNIYILTMDMPRFITPFKMGLFGRRESGKTYFVTELLRKQESMIKGPFKKVIWICKTFQHEVYEKLMQEQQFEIEFMDELPNFDAIGKQESTAIVLDDLMTEASNNEQVCALFTRGRLLNVSVIYLSQNLFHQGKYSRDINLNLDYIVLHKNPRDLTQVKILGQQMYPHAKHFLSWAYNDAVNKEQYSHLVLDLKPYTDNSLRVRSKIFEQFPIFYIEKNL